MSFAVGRSCVPNIYVYADLQYTHTISYTRERPMRVSDDILEFLFLKGIQAVAVHGGKDQEERQWSVKNTRKAGKMYL